MKKIWCLLLALCLGFCLSASAEETPVPAPFDNPQEIHLAAAGLMLYAPGDLETLDGDECAYDSGFRFDCFNDTFDFTLYVNDSRDMTLKEYAAFFADRNHMKAEADTVNGYPCYRLTDPAKKDGSFTLLIADTTEDDTPPVYQLAFMCDGEKDVKLANDILSTIAPY